MEPIKFEYLTNSEIEKDLSKIQLAIRGIGDESYISFNRLLNDTQINSMSTNMNGAKEDASGLTGGLGDFLELITDEVSKLQVFSSLMKTITASRFAPHIAAIAASFLILRNSILGNKELTEKQTQLRHSFSIYKKPTHNW